MSLQPAMRRLVKTPSNSKETALHTYRVGRPVLLVLSISYLRDASSFSNTKLLHGTRIRSRTSARHGGMQLYLYEFACLDFTSSLSNKVVGTALVFVAKIAGLNIGQLILLPTGRVRM